MLVCPPPASSAHKSLLLPVEEAAAEGLFDTVGGVTCKHQNLWLSEIVLSQDSQGATVNPSMKVNATH